MKELSQAIMELVGDYVKKRGVGEQWDHEQVMSNIITLELVLRNAQREIGLLEESLEPALRPREGLHLVDRNDRLLPLEARLLYTGPTPPEMLPARIHYIVVSANSAWDRVRSMIQRLELPPIKPEGE